jgi:hypothetical protein
VVDVHNPVNKANVLIVTNQLYQLLSIDNLQIIKKKIFSNNNNMNINLPKQRNGGTPTALIYCNGNTII